MTDRTEEELIRAKAEGWRECVAWFASEPQRIYGHLHRVHVDVLQEAEDSNPYDRAVTRRPADG